MPLILFNPGTTAVVLQQAGITIRPGQNYDVTRRIGGLLATSEELQGHITQQTLRVRRETSSPIFLQPAEAIRAVRLEEAPSNLAATVAPSVNDDLTSGYAFGSLWRFGSRVWQCQDSAIGAARWIELVPTGTVGIAIGRYYGSLIQGVTNGAGQALVADTLYAMPFYFPPGYTFNRVGVENTTNGGGGSLVRIGVYSNLNGAPGTRLSTFGTASIQNTGVKEIAITYASTGEVIWVVFHTSAAVSFRAIRNGWVNTVDVGSLTQTSGASQTYLAAGAYAAGLPVTFPTLTSNANPPPYIWFRSL